MSTERIELHRQGARYLREGRYPEAQRVLERALGEHGSHVAVRSDLAFVAYLQGDLGAFRLLTEALEHELDLAGQGLSPRSRLLTHVSLAKFLEELARVHEALEHVEAARALLTAGDSQLFLVSAQRLRLLACYGREDELATVYRDCLQASQRDPQAKIECAHALLLAEARLLGWDAAFARLEEFARCPELQAADLRLAGFDLLEIALEKGATERVQQALRFLGPAAGADAYEKELLSLAHGAPAVNELKLLRWTAALPPMAQLRLLALECVRPGGNAAGARARLSLLLEGLDHRSRAFLSRKWQACFAAAPADALELLVDEAARSVRCGEKAIHFGARAQPWELLRLFSGAEKVSPDEALRALGRRDSETERESLRIAVLRLNKKLAPLMGVAWVLKYGKQELSRNPACRISLPQ